MYICVTLIIRYDIRYASPLYDFALYTRYNRFPSKNDSRRKMSLRKKMFLIILTFLIVLSRRHAIMLHVSSARAFVIMTQLISSIKLTVLYDETRRENLLNKS